MNKRNLAALLLFFASFAFLYRKVFGDLVYDWWRDDNYSHGFVILPLALYFAWERRDAFSSSVIRPNNLGLLVVLGSLAMLLVGLLGVEFFVTRMSILGVISGFVLFVFGWGRLRVLLFPIAFLILMIPIPAIVFNQIAFPLQLLASRFGEWTLIAFGVPVLREGNVIQLANTNLEVAEACSGIRSLISLLTLGIVYGYFTDSRIGFRLALALVTIPIAIFANGMRVAGTGVAAHYYGKEAAEGFFHTFSGWIIFLVAFLCLLSAHGFLRWMFPPVREKAGGSA